MIKFRSEKCVFAFVPRAVAGKTWSAFLSSKVTMMLFSCLRLVQHHLSSMIAKDTKMANRSLIPPTSSTKTTTTTTRVPSLSQRAAKLKERGNALFGKRQLPEAVACYSRALILLNQEEEETKRNHRHPEQSRSSITSSSIGVPLSTTTHDKSESKKDLLLYAVLCSNRSACYYEMGDFNHAAIDASSCIDYIDELLRWQHKFEHTLAHTPILSPADEAKAVSMRSANQWRRTRALLYQHDGDLQQAQARLDFLCLKDDDGGDNDNNERNPQNKQQKDDEHQESPTTSSGA